MPTKIGGVLTIFGAVVVLMVLPRIDNAIYQSAKTRPLYFFFY
jgi:quinol-cytochrome oxidoreductase complex cytochrome b subunit